MAKNEVKISITGDASKLGKALGDGEKQLSGFSSKADQIGSKMQQVGAAATVGVTMPLLAMGASSVKAFMEAEQSQAQLEASLKSTGATAWTSAGQMDDLASSMQDKLAIDGDLIKSGQSVLLTFTNVRNEVGEGNDIFDQATQLAADLSVKLGTDLQSANILLGKALNDPVKGMTALQRAGVQLSDSQKEQVKQFIAVGDVMSAQKIILQELETQFGGSAEAFAGTNAGKLAAAKLQFEDIQEEVGEKLIPALSKLGEVASGGLGVWDRLGNSGQNFVLVMGGIAAAAGPVTGAVGSVIRLGEGIGSLREKMATAQVGSERMSRSIGALGKVAAGVGGVIAGIAIAESIGAAANVLGDYAQEAEDAMNRARKALLDKDDAAAVGGFADSVAGVQKEWLGVGEVFSSVGREMKVGSTGIQADIENIDVAFKRMLAESPQAADALVDALKRQMDVLEPTSREYKDTADMVGRFEERLGAANLQTEVSAEEQKIATDATAELGGAMQETAEAFASVDEALNASADNLALWNSNADAAAAGATAFADSIERTSQIDDALSNASKLGTVMRGFGDTVKALPKDIDQTKLALGGYNEEQQKSIDALVAAGDANTEYLSGLLAQGSSSEEVAFRADVLRQEYLKQAKQLGLNDEQTQDYLDTLGLTPKKVETAIQLSKVAEAEFKIRAYQGVINATPPNKLTSFNAAIARGDYIAAAAALDELARPRPVFFGVNVVGAGAAQGVLRGIQNIAGRAGGGPVSAGVPYIVGEKGPELIFPERDGMVMTASETAALMSSAGGSSRPVGFSAASTTPVYITVDMRGAIAPTSADFDRMIAQGLERAVAGGVRIPRTARAVAAGLNIRR